MRYHIIVADPDEEYLMRLGKFVRNDEQWRQKVELQMATTLVHLEELLTISKPLAVVVAPAWLASVQDITQNHNLFTWDNCDDELVHHVPQLKKYGSVSSWLEQLLSTCQINHHGNHRTSNSKSKESTQVIAVYSASGGAGKTTLCLHLSREWLRKRKKVLYINLEEIPSISLFSDLQSLQADRMIYVLQQRPEQFAQKWQQWVRKHRDFGFDYTPPIPNILDHKLLNDELLIRFIDVLKKSGQYDKIIVDLNSGVSDIVVSSFKLADRIVWLESEDAIGKDKSRRMQQAMDEIFDTEVHAIRNKLKFVNNRMLMQTKEQVGLPYVSVWKQRNDWKDVWNHEIYAIGVSHLCRSWEGDVP